MEVEHLGSKYVTVFEGLAKLLAELDVLLSFAVLAASGPTPYTRPEITSSDNVDIILEGSRHPCVEAQDWVKFIPKDCESWFQIITSPNMGAKSTFILQDNVDIILEGSRHPCVEAQDWVKFIPKDCKLVRGESWFQIITSPNMGAKSTFILQVWLGASHWITTKYWSKN